MDAKCCEKKTNIVHAGEQNSRDAWCKALAASKAKPSPPSSSFAAARGASSATSARTSRRRALLAAGGVAEKSACGMKLDELNISASVQLQINGEGTSEEPAFALEAELSYSYPCVKAGTSIHSTFLKPP